ncbi:MAG: hypothetical protein NVS3B25_31040 [Hymenobacter sp.]
MESDIAHLQSVLADIEEEFGGEVAFLPVASEEAVTAFEKALNWQLPGIFRYLLMTESNGLVIGNKRILSLLDASQRKTLVDNLERHNHAATSPWFKGRPHIFQDYVVFGTDGDSCFCYSKKYELFNPAVYICSNANSTKGVDFDRLDLDLADLIRFMVDKEFS